MSLTPEVVAARKQALETWGIDAKEIPLRSLVPTDTVLALLESLVRYGFTKEDICAMARKGSTFFNLTSELTGQRLGNLETHGFTKEDVRTMVRKLPAILHHTHERTNQNLAIMSSIDCDARKQTHRLMFAPALLRGRIAFLRSQGQPLTEKNLFLSNQNFSDLFSIERADLLLLDPGAEDSPAATRDCA